MPFRSAKRKSGTTMSGATGRSSSRRVAKAGMSPGGGRNRARGSKAFEIAAPIIDEVNVVLATGFDVVILHSQQDQVDLFDHDVIGIVTVNPGVPTAAQLIAGNDSTGVAAADAVTNTAVNPGNSFTFLGLTADTLYYFYFINVPDIAAPIQYQGSVSKITQGKQKTAAI